MVEFSSELTVKLLTVAGSDASIARSAWVSSNSNGDEDRIKGLIRSLMKQRHGTPFESGYFEFWIDVPRSVSIEMMRHRIGWSFSSASLRYREQEQCIYVPPQGRPLKRSEDFKSMRPVYEALSEEEYTAYFDALIDAHTDMAEHYNRLRETRPETEALRWLTSESLYLPYIARCNPRSLMHFLSLRTHDPEASHVSYPMWEIERVAHQIENHFADHFPVTHAFFCEFGREAP